MWNLRANHDTAKYLKASMKRVFSNLGWKTVDSRDASILVSVSGLMPSSCTGTRENTLDTKDRNMTVIIMPFEGYWTLKFVL